MVDTVRPVAPLAPSRARAPRSRIRLPWLVVAACGFLMATVLVLWAVSRAGARTEVLVVARPVKAGDVLSADAIEIRAASLEGGLTRVYRRSQRDAVVGSVAVVDLAPGDVLGPSVLTGAPRTRPGELLVGAVLRPGRYPPRVRASDEGVVVSLGDPRAAAPVAVAVRVVAVAVGETAQATVTLAVPAGSAGMVEVWAGTDTLGLVVSPLGSGAAPGSGVGGGG